MLEGGDLFKGLDPKTGVYDEGAHLAEMISVLGPPPKALLDRGKNSSLYFDADGNARALPRRLSIANYALPSSQGNL